MKTNRKPHNSKMNAVDKALILLEILSKENVPMSLTRITQISKLSFSTAYRLINTLCRNGFVECDQETDHYKLAVKAFLIGNAALRNIKLRPIALPYLNQFAQATGESIFLAILLKSNIIYSDCMKAGNPLQIGIQISVPIPACHTSSGKVLISNLPELEQQALADFYFQDQLINDRDQFLADLKSIKQQGFCFGASEFGRMIYEMSIPIYDHLKNCAGTLSIFKLKNNDTLTKQEEKLLQELKKIGAEISQAMGYQN